jgi:2,3-bisphosphoglycerate-dependent phosphoglycerate mutase
MGDFLVIRHAESIYGNKNIYSGIIDIPLSTKGIEQAKKVATKVGNLCYDIVYTSTLIRSLETALIILNNDSNVKIPVRVEKNQLKEYIQRDRFLPILEIEELNERNYGELQNLSKDEVKKIYKTDEIQMWRRGFHLAPPSGESFKDVVKRIKSFMDTYLFPFIDEKDIFVVAHQNSMRALYFLLLNETEENIEKIEFDNCDFMYFEIRNCKVEKFAINEIKK